jgi:hypothetical protein
MTIPASAYFKYFLAFNHSSTMGASRSTHLANPFTKSRLYDISAAMRGIYLCQSTIEALDIFILEKFGDLIRLLFRRKFAE